MFKVQEFLIIPLITVAMVIVATVFFVFLSSMTVGEEDMLTDHRIYVGRLRFEVESPSVVAPNKYFEVNISIFVHVQPINLKVESIIAEITGAGISWTETLVNNLTITSYWTYNKTATVNPTTEDRPIDLVLTINMQDLYRNNDIYTTTDMNIAHSQGKDANIYQYFTYVFIATTITFLITTSYLLRKRRNSTTVIPLQSFASTF